MSAFSGDAPATPQPLVFRVTGKSACDRLIPLLLGQNWGSGVTWIQANDDQTAKSAAATSPLAFVYETTATKDWRRRHQEAGVLNRLHGLAVVEDKGNAALLQCTMAVPTLESHVLPDRAAVAAWAASRWGSKTAAGSVACRCTDPAASAAAGSVMTAPVDMDDDVGAGGGSRGGEGNAALSRAAAAAANGGGGNCAVEAAGLDAGAGAGGGTGDSDWWCVKATRGNGGTDVWVLRDISAAAVLPRLPAGDAFVLQRYVCRPLLRAGKKFHLRAYLLWRADGAAWLYRRAYALAASRDFEAHAHEDDELVHITNLSRNKKTEGYPGQVPCEVPDEYPELWPRLTALAADLVAAASPFLAEQTSPRHFELLGLDVLPDRDGGCWLMEVNRLPGLASSKQNRAAEDAFYNRMCIDMIRIVALGSIGGGRDGGGGSDGGGSGDCGSDGGSGGSGNDGGDGVGGGGGGDGVAGVKTFGLWEVICGPLPEINTTSREPWKNLLRWAVHVRMLKRDAYVVSCPEKEALPVVGAGTKERRSATPVVTASATCLRNQ